MIAKNIRTIMASVAGVAVATSAMGEGTAGPSANVYGLFRSEMTYSNGGLAKIEEGAKASSTTALGLNVVKFGVKGTLNDKASFNLRFNFLKPTSADLVDIAYVSWKASDMFSMTMGKDYVRQGGFSNQDNTFNHIWGDRTQALTFGRNQESLSLHYTLGAMHKVTVQLVNDIVDIAETTAKEAQYNTSSKQPAAILEYSGEFGSIKPLIQYGQYDLNHSSFWNVGARAKLDATSLTFDYGANSEFMVVGDSDKASVSGNMTLRAEHDMGTMVPFFWYNAFNVTDKDVNGGTEKKTNTTAKWDDNATQISIGSSFKNFGDNWTPYVAYRMTSGKFMNSANKEKTGNTHQLGLGVTGQF